MFGRAGLSGAAKARRSSSLFPDLEVETEVERVRAGHFRELLEKWFVYILFFFSSIFCLPVTDFFI